MASPKMPTKREINQLERLLNIREKVRKTLLKQRQEDERTYGRNNLPELVLPEPAKATRQSMRRLLRKAGYERWRKQVESLRKATNYTDTESFYRENYKKPILQAWTDALITQFGYDPVNLRAMKSRLGKDYFIKTAIPKEEIEEVRSTNPQLAEFLEGYNKLFRMNIKDFIIFYSSGLMPQFKFIYLEMLGEAKEYSALEEFNEGLAQLRAGKINTKGLNLPNRNTKGKRLNNAKRQ